MLNAGRGNPNWIATEPREAFFLLGKFGLCECRRVQSLEEGIAGIPQQEGIAARFEAFLKENEKEAGARLLKETYNYMPVSYTHLKLRYLWGKQNEITFTNFDQKGIHEKLYPLNVSVVIGVGVNISRIFFDFRYEQGLGNISKSLVYDNINSDGSTGVSPIIFRRRDSALCFSFGFIL